MLCVGRCFREADGEQQEEVDCGMRIAECGLRNMDYGLRNTGSVLTARARGLKEDVCYEKR